MEKEKQVTIIDIKTGHEFTMSEGGFNSTMANMTFGFGSKVAARYKIKGKQAKKTAAKKKTIEPVEVAKKTAAKK